MIISIMSQIGKMVSPIGRHVGLVHNFDVSVMQFMAFDRVYKEERGGDFNKRVLQRKTKWIHSLKATVPPGLNDSISFFFV